MTKTYTWTTPKGAKIEATITTEHITKKTVSADGWPIEIKCNDWVYTLDELKVNGKPTKMKMLSQYAGQDCIIIDKVGKDTVMAAIPADISEDIYGEERRQAKARFDANVEFERKMDAKRQAVYDMMMGKQTK